MVLPVEISHWTSIRLIISTPLPDEWIGCGTLRSDVKPLVQSIGLNGRSSIVKAERSSKTLFVRKRTALVDVRRLSFSIDHRCETGRMKRQNEAKSLLVQRLFRLCMDVMRLTRGDTMESSHMAMKHLKDKTKLSRWFSHVTVLTEWIVLIVHHQILIGVATPNIHQSVLLHMTESSQRQTLLVGCTTRIESTAVIDPRLFAQEWTNAVRMDRRRTAVLVQLEEILQFDLLPIGQGMITSDGLTFHDTSIPPANRLGRSAKILVFDLRKMCPQMMTFDTIDAQRDAESNDLNDDRRNALSRRRSSSN